MNATVGFRLHHHLTAERYPLAARRRSADPRREQRLAGRLLQRRVQHRPALDVVVVGGDRAAELLGFAAVSAANMLR